MLSLPSLCGLKINMDMKFEFGFCEGRPSDGAPHKMIFYIDHAIWIFYAKKRPPSALVEVVPSFTRI